MQGGQPLILASTLGTLGASGTWGPHGDIVFSPGQGSGLFRISEEGGVPEVLTHPEGDTHVAPHVLPDGKHVLFTVGTGGESRTLGLLSLETMDWKPLGLENVAAAMIAASGHLVFARSGGLQAAPFDLERLTLAGPPVSVLESVLTDFGGGSAQYAVSRNGTLVYLPGLPETRLVWVNRQGDSRPLIQEPGTFISPRLSPDGRRLAVVLADTITGRRDIWVRDLTRGTFLRLTSTDLEFAHEPVWAPDGRRIAFAARKVGSKLNRNLFVSSLDGTGQPAQLTSNEIATIPTSWAPDGKLIFFHDGNNLGVLRVDEPDSDEMIIETPFVEMEASLSSNGRWLAYVSNETGRNEVYVTTYPSLDRRWPVSVNGGTEPLWVSSGQELFYRSGDKMMVVDVGSGPEFSASKPIVLFKGPYAVDPVGKDAVNYDVTADGKEFVMIEEERLAPSWNVVLNWIEELKRLVPIE